MKVLFAVSNESISEAIIKKYQQMYKEIISSKNVYYFNAIIKELQKDKSYDRIVISEDLEPFASKNYDTIDNFLFEKLDSISDEASNVQGEDIPIILISTDRRTKGESLLVKLFGIGVYSALIGQDRSIEQVCNLINKPRSKKEAKVYYKISSGEVEYKAESEGDVSEVEIQNILAHYKRLGKNEEKYVTSFNSIANQYTDQQLRLIIKFLPLNVKAVLEAQCPRYQQVVAYSGSGTSEEDSEKEYKNSQSKFSKKHEKQNKVDKQAEKAGLKIESIKTDKNSSVLSKPVIIPSEVTTKNIKKVEQKGRNMENKQNGENQVENLEQNSKMQEPHRIIRSNSKIQETEKIIKQNSQQQEQHRIIKSNNEVQQQRVTMQNSQIQAQRKNTIQNNQIQGQQRNAIQNNQMQDQQRNAMQNNQMQDQQRNVIQNNQVQGQQRNMTQNNGMQAQRVAGQNIKKQENIGISEVAQMSGMQDQVMQEPQKYEEQNVEIQETPTVQEQPKRGRGRPKKVLTEEEILAQANVVKRKRGRPRKVQIEEIEQQSDSEAKIDENILPEVEDYKVEESNILPKAESIVEENSDILSEFESFDEPSNNTLPGFEDFEQNTNQVSQANNIEDELLPGFDNFNEQNDTNNILPGFNDFNSENEYDNNMFSDFEDDGMLPGMDDYTKKDGMIPVVSENDEDNMLPRMDDFEENDKLPNINDQSDNMLPGIDSYDENNDILSNMNNYEQNDDILPGMNNYNQSDDILLGMDNYSQDNDILPGINSYEESNNTLSEINEYQSNMSQTNNMENNNYSGVDNFDLNSAMSNYENQNNNNNFAQQMQTQNINANIDTESLLSGDRKIVGFVGTSKNGTSFIVDNLAQMLSNQGIKTAILDLTQNRNAYYIYTKNEENLRRIAIDCMKNLELGMANGIKVNPNLDVYTSLPGEQEEIENVNNVITTLTQRYSLVLVDCDFKSDYRYIANLQELYLVQSMDVLTIQPLTAYLRDLKAKGILDQSKLRIVINKYLRVRSLTEKTIIGGMAFYNDPAMSFMTELFNRETIKYTVIPFDTQAYSKYLEGLVNCEISLSGYSKEMIAELRKLANMVYPLVTNTQKYGKEYNKKQKTQYGQYQKNFSNEMNNTLNKMKKNY